MNINTVGVIGAGTMGSGIAQACATSGLNVILVDIEQKAVDRGLEKIRKSLERLQSRDSITELDKTVALERIRGTTRYDDLTAAQIVIEAATENQAIKSKILRQLDDLLPAGAIIATNTSSISITELASVTERSDRFIGMHFFNPVPMMSLVELVRGLDTSDATHATVRDLAEKLGKTAIDAQNKPGFVVNRILVPMINEAFFVLSEGIATAEDIDAGMRLGCNHPIGPLALADLIGLDVCLAIMEVFFKQFADGKYRACPLLREMVAAGRLGRKTGRGVYSYAAKPRAVAKAA